MSSVSRPVRRRSLKCFHSGRLNSVSTPNPGRPIPGLRCLNPIIEPPLDKQPVSMHILPLPAPLSRLATCCFAYDTPTGPVRPLLCGKCPIAMFRRRFRPRVCSLSRLRVWTRSVLRLRSRPPPRPAKGVLGRQRSVGWIRPVLSDGIYARLHYVQNTQYSALCMWIGSAHVLPDE